MADTKQIDWGDGSGEKITVTASSFVGNKGLQIQSPENVKVTPRSKTIVLKSKTDPTKVARINVTQEKAVYTYDFTLTASVPTIAAKGGSSIISAQLKTYRNGNLIETKTVTPVLSGTGTGFSISGTTVSASNRTTVVGSERSIPVTGKFSGTFDGQEVSATVVVKQEANSQSLRGITSRYTSSNPYTGQNTVKANGGTVRVYTFAIYDYTSGSTSESNVSDECTFGNVTFGTWDSEKHTWTCPTAGTTIYSEHRGTSIQVKWGSKSTVYYLYQQANLATYDSPVVILEYSRDIPASGGSVTPTSASARQAVSFTSGATDSIYVSNLVYSGTGVNTSTGAVSATSLGTTVKDRSAVTTATLTATANGKSGTASATVYQQANAATSITYGTPLVSLSVQDIPASGGSVSSGTVTYSQSRIQNYTSGATSSLSSLTSGGTVSYSTAVSAGSLGTTVKSRTKIGTLTATVSMNGQSGSNSADVYQQANAVDEILYGVPDVNVVFPDIPASGGSVSSGIVTYSQSRTQRYTSGSTLAMSPVTSGGSVSYTSPVSAPSLGTTVKARTAIDTITVSVELNGKTGQTAELIYQQANLLTWNNPVITYAYSDIAASGGTVTPSLSITQSGNYTSGSTASNTTIGSKSFSGTGVNTSTGAYTASSLGTTVKARTKLSAGTVTVTANGKSASKSADIYQAENKIERYNYGAWSISISANPTTIAYGGGTSTISASCTRSKTPVYSSGATGSADSESATPTLSGSATGFTLSGTTVTASVNSWAATRSITVTASYSGATSKSVTVTQAAAPASISLNKATIAFPQRASSNTVQVTCNSDWSVNSNAEFTIPETLQIKYNPNTDVVELVDQPVQIIKKVQESSDYALAFIRIGSHQEPYSHTPTKAISRRDIASAKNSGGFVTKMNEWLISQSQNKAYHRIVARNWFYNGNATRQIQAGTEVLRNSGMASLMPSDTLISKPGKALGLRNVGLVIPKSLRFLLAEAWRFYRLTSLNANIEVDVNNKTGRIKFTVSEFSNVADSRARSPKESFMRCQSQIGPVGYILYKKASTTEYLDVRGWKEVSNFALARSLSDNEIKVKSSGGVEIVVMKFKYGED